MPGHSGTHPILNESNNDFRKQECKGPSKRPQMGVKLARSWRGVLQQFGIGCLKA